jgi:hypothetical protein
MRLSLVIAALALSACDPASPDAKSKPAPVEATRAPGGQLAGLASGATVVGYLYSADTPYIVATIEQGTLLWRSQGGANPVAQGPIATITDSDRTCIGFKQKNPTMATRGPERYLICEATASITHSNSLPRSQDFSLSPGTLFLEYDPPAGTGFVQIFYARRTK